MDDLHRLEAKGLARAKVRSQRRRVATIRRRTIRASLGLFAIFWAIIFGQLVTGNDPVLSRAHAGVHTPKPSAPSAAGGAPETAATEPERESGQGFESESETEFEGSPETGAEPEPEAGAAAEPETQAEPAPEPSAPIVTSAS